MESHFIYINNLKQEYTNIPIEFVKEKENSLMKNEL
jgi:hypothetical protein